MQEDRRVNYQHFIMKTHRVQEFRMDEKDKESGEMANLVPKAFVPLNTKHGKVKHIPKGPFHSKFKQVGLANIIDT